VGPGYSLARIPGWQLEHEEAPMLTLEQVQKLFEPLLPGLMGVEIVEATQEKIVATMLVRPDLCTAGGVCHGGAFMAFADTIGAVGTVMNLAPGTRTTTIESKTNFLGAAPVNTRITAESTPLHRGKTTQVWQTMIRSEAGKLCAVVTQTQMVLPA
jgi:1,4-dihydroxy-2-naphthoyl-CoA hydrolase